MSEELADITRALGRHYDKKAEQWGYCWPSNVSAQLAANTEAILEGLASPERADIALDIGTGRRARYLTRIRRLVSKCVGIDISQSTLRSAAKYIADVASGEPGMFVAASATSLPFRDGTFSLVVCSEVMEYYPIHCVRLLLADIRRILLPRGRLVVDFPSYANSSAWEVKAAEERDGTAFYIYPESLIRSTILETDFCVTATATADCETIYLLNAP